MAIGSAVKKEDTDQKLTISRMKVTPFTCHLDYLNREVFPLIVANVSVHERE
jgi:hypothetical protein